jgi:hypothetical protein
MVPLSYERGFLFNEKNMLNRYSHQEEGVLFNSDLSDRSNAIFIFNAVKLTLLKGAI